MSTVMVAWPASRAGMSLPDRGEPPTDLLGKLKLWWELPAFGWSGPSAGAVVLWGLFFVVVAAVVVAFVLTDGNRRSRQRRGTRRGGGSRR